MKFFNVYFLVTKKIRVYGLFYFSKNIKNKCQLQSILRGVFGIAYFLFLSAYHS